MCDMKTETGKYLPLLLPFFLTCGCDLIGEGRLPDRSRAETEVRRRTDKETADTTQTLPEPEEDPSVLWISGVEYPLGYDWQRDTAYGQVDARLVLLKNGVRVLEIPVGEQHESGSDPDMHRICGGHLYTDYSSGTETVIRRDGKVLFRFAGREMMAGFLVRGETVWTLGVSRSTGKGLVLRKDGKEVFSDPEGQLPPGFTNAAFEGGLLHLDGDEMYFFYHTGSRWFQVREQFAEPVALGGTMSEVHDIRHIGGKTVIAGRTPSYALALSEGGYVRPCTLSSGAFARNVSLVPVGDGRYFLKGEAVRGSVTVPTVWTSEGYEYLSAAGPVLDFCIEDGYAAYVSAGYDGVPSSFSVNGVQTPIEGRNHFISNRCALLHNGVFYLLLTPMDHVEPPFLLIDGVRKEIPLNGYLTGMGITR